MAVLLRTDDKAQVVHPKNGDKFTLDELQGYVEGYIEVVYPTPGIFVLAGVEEGRTTIVEAQKGSTLWVNEEGKLNGLPVNKLATMVYGNPNDVVVGPALLCGESEVD